MVENRIFLGKVILVSEKVAIMEPVLFSGEDGNSWEDSLGPIQRLKMFPDRGNVFWFRPNTSLVLKESFWEFGVETHPEYQKKPTNTEQYQVRWHPEPFFKEAVEIIDLRKAGDEDEIRKRLTSEEGMPLKSHPVMRKVMLWIRDDRCVGPVYLKVCRNDRWCIDSVCETDNGSLVLDAYDPGGSYQSVNCNGYRFTVPQPGLNLGKRVGIYNWESDDVILKKVIKKIGKFDPAFIRALNVTNKILDSYLTLFDSKESGFLSSDLEQEFARAERIRNMKDLLERNTPIVDEAIQLFTSSGHFKSRIAEIETEVANKALEEAKARIDQDYKGKISETEKLKKNIETKKAELVSIEKKLKKQNEELDSKFKGYETEFSKKLSVLASDPQSFFPELSAFRYALGGGSAPPSSGNGILEGLPVGEISSVDISLLGDKPELVKALRSAYHKSGFPFQLADRILSIFLSGVVPVVAGDRAFEALEILSRYVAGGRLSWIPVSGSMFEPHDLFGSTDRTGRFVSHPAGILDSIREAHADPDRLFMVVLDGFNRAPIDAYLLPLLQCRADRTNSRSLPICTVVSDGCNGGHGKPVRVTWPRNLLLALLPLNEGAFSPTLQFWDYAALLDSDRGPFLDQEKTAAIGHPDASDQPSDRAEVSGSLWGEMRNEAIAGQLTGMESWLPAMEEQMPDNDFRNAIRIYSAYMSIKMDPGDAKQHAVFSTVLPKCHPNGDSAKDILGRIGMEIDKDTEKVLSAIVRIGGR